jgi:hypothetical protein
MAFHYGKHSHEPFGRYTDALCKAFKCTPSQLQSKVFQQKAEHMDSRDFAPTNFHIVHNGESEFRIIGEEGQFIDPSTIEVLYSVQYANSHANADIKTKLSSGDIIGQISLNGSNHFVGCNPDQAKQRGAQTAKEAIAWAAINKTKYEYKNDALKQTHPAYQTKSLPQYIKRDHGAGIIAPVQNLIQDALYDTYHDVNRIANGTAHGADETTSAAWLYKEIPSYRHSHNAPDNNGWIPRFVKLHDIMDNDFLNTNQLIPAHNDTQIRVKPNPRNPVTVGSFRNDLDALNQEYDVTLHGIRYTRYMVTSPAVQKQIDILIGKEYVFPGTQIGGRQKTVVEGQNDITIEADPGKGYVILAGLTCQGAGMFLIVFVWPFRASKITDL